MNTSLDPEVRALVAEVNAAPVAFESEDRDAQQHAFDQLIARLQPNPTPPFDGTISDGVITTGDHQARVRRYLPAEAVREDSVIAYFHGGGWVLGGLDSHDRFARALANGTGTAVVSVDYTLATVAPFPAAFDEAYATIQAVRGEGATWVGVAGDSAGGNLAAAAALASTRRGEPVDAQLLLYPALDASCSQASMQTFGEGYLLTESAMRYYWDTYAAGADRHDERLSPLAASSLEHVAPAVIAAARVDPLVDEGATFARRLTEADVPTTYLPFPALVHGFVDYTDRAEAARVARDAAVEAFAELHRSQVAGR